MRVAIECPASSNAVLRARARHIAQQLPARTPERRAVVACWIALSDTSSLDSARRALRTFGSERTQADAAAILDSLAGQRDCAIGWDNRRGYHCTHCGTTAHDGPQATATPGD